MRRNRRLASSRRVLGQGAIVLLFTDGLEREAGSELAFEADRLHRSCRRLIWLNPLLRFDGFEAKAKGKQVVRPKEEEPAEESDLLAALEASLKGAKG